MRCRNSFATLIIASISICLSGTADAGWNEFWQRVQTDFQRNNCWPEPFVHAERNSVRAFMNTQKDNGWRHQTTVMQYHFDETTNELNAMGTQKLDWIVRQAPSSRRTVYVLQSTDQHVTRARVDAVQREISRILPTGALPPVLTTDHGPAGGSGMYLDSIGRSYIESIPEPRITAAGGGGEGE